MVAVFGLVSAVDAPSDGDAPFLAHRTFAGERPDEVGAHAGVGASVTSRFALVLVHAAAIRVRNKPDHAVAIGRTAHLA